MTEQEKLRRIAVVVERAIRFGDNSDYIDEIKSILDDEADDSDLPLRF